MKATALVIALTLAMSGCATTPTYATYEPIVDMKRVDPQRYVQDLGECRAYAARVDQEAATAAGAVAGAVIMGLFAAAVGLRGRDVATVAAAGAAAGGAQSNVNAGLTQAQIIANCLIVRGYAVLG